MGRLMEGSTELKKTPPYLLASHMTARFDFRLRTPARTQSGPADLTDFLVVKL